MAGEKLLARMESVSCEPPLLTFVIERHGGTMTKRNIVRRIADELGRPQLETMLIVQKTLDAIVNVLAGEVARTRKC